MYKWDSYPNWLVTEARPLLPHYSFNTLCQIAFAEIQGEVQVILIWNKLYICIPKHPIDTNHLCQNKQTKY